MSLVVIEGVVDSDVSARGARHEVQWTDRLANLVRNGLVRVVSGGPDTEPEPVVAKFTKGGVVRKRRRAADPEPEVLVIEAPADELPVDEPTDE